jgi:hypothetical protein
MNASYIIDGVSSSATRYNGRPCLYNMSICRSHNELCNVESIIRSGRQAQIEGISLIEYTFISEEEESYGGL